MASQADQEVLIYIRRCAADREITPSYREIATATGYSLRTVALAVNRLTEAGLLERAPGQHRSLRVVKVEPR